MMKSTLPIKSLFLVFCVVLLSPGYSQEIEKEKIPLVHGAHHVGKRMDTDMVRWRSYRFGQFIHWGLYSILGGDYNGKHYADAGGAAEWIRSWKEVPHDVYDNLYKNFYLTEFHADEWASMSKKMGAKYVTFTTKHHDGFCMWPSKYTDYTIANTPYKKDIVKQIVDAYTRAGIDVYLYYSILDWHNPDWRYDLKTKEDSIAFDRFKLFTKNQLTELLNNYPEIKGFWFDGTWDNSWKKSGAFTDSLEQYLKKTHPGLIIGSRLRADDKGNRHFDANGELMGDYEQGWERKIPKTYADTHDNDWECVMTIPENGWGYSKTWLGHWKTSAELIEMMAQTVSLGGNFVLNFGPEGNGTFRTREREDAREIGDWLKNNGDAIYGCGYSGWEKQDWGYYTRKAGTNKYFMIVFNMPVTRKLEVKPADKVSVKSAWLNAAPDRKLQMEKIDYGASYIMLPPEFNATKPFVIVLETTEGAEVSEGPKAKT